LPPARKVLLRARKVLPRARKVLPPAREQLPVQGRLPVGERLPLP
jgi:hypothetical protein